MTTKVVPLGLVSCTTTVPLYLSIVCFKIYNSKPVLPISQCLNPSSKTLFLISSVVPFPKSFENIATEKKITKNSEIPTPIKLNIEVDFYLRNICLHKNRRTNATADLGPNQYAGIKFLDAPQMVLKY